MSTTRARAGSRRGPIGKAAVVNAILEAAAELFADKGPTATSIRDVATAAGVNHGLVHRHLGGKDELVGAVLDHLGRQLAELLQGGAPDQIEIALRRQVRVIARAALDGYPPGELQSVFPNVVALIDSARDHHGDDLEARLSVANAVALRMGWQLFADLLCDAAGLADVPASTVAASVASARTRILGYQPDSNLVIGG